MVCKQCYVAGSSVTDRQRHLIALLNHSASSILEVSSLARDESTHFEMRETKTEDTMENNSLFLKVFPSWLSRKQIKIDVYHGWFGVCSITVDTLCSWKLFWERWNQVQSSWFFFLRILFSLDHMGAFW
jgi:hypothetical protein